MKNENTQNRQLRYKDVLIEYYNTCVVMDLSIHSLKLNHPLSHYITLIFLQFIQNSSHILSSIDRSLLTEKSTKE